MKYLTVPLLALFAAITLSSCVAAYKTGQTPDDVYYSPAYPVIEDEYLSLGKQGSSYDGSDDYYEDRFLRMRLEDRYRWSVLDDYYFYNTYAYNPYGYYHNWYSPWNSYWTWNIFYNPYCVGIPYYHGIGIIKTPGISVPPPSRAVVFNPNSYSNSANRSVGGSSLRNSFNNNSNSRYNNRNNNSSGTSGRRVFTNSNSNSNNNSTPTRSYRPSSNSSSNSSSSPSRSSSSGSSGGSISRPPR